MRGHAREVADRRALESALDGELPLARLPLEIQVIGVELSEALKPCVVKNCKMSVLELDQVLTPKELDRAVNVDIREPKALAQLGLGQGKIKPIIFCAPDDLKPHEQLAKKMSHSSCC